MSHATESLQYMSGLADRQVFRFCAIPQVMAIATLAACYNNPNVFKTVVKIPRSMRCVFCCGCGCGCCCQARVR
jgi:farnesyl-diphosphate farnesyltransferase